jgi:hypothetical protein
LALSLHLAAISMLPVILPAPVRAAVSQDAYLKASNTQADDKFGGANASFSGAPSPGTPHGVAIAIWEDTIVVGASGEDSIARGVNGDQSDNSATNAGAVYVFVRQGTNWSQQAYLKASNTEPLRGSEDPIYGDAFGISVALEGDTLVVGAYLEDSNATGVNGNQNDNSSSHSGAAYVFVRDGTNWSQQAYLKPSNTYFSYRFGYAVAISGDTIIVGAPRADINWGAAYVFVRDGTNWSQQAHLAASNLGDRDLFGAALGISGDTIIVGAPWEDSNATGVDGNQTNNSALDSGAAYMFVRSGTNWSQQAYLKASNTRGVPDIFAPPAMDSAGPWLFQATPSSWVRPWKTATPPVSMATKVTIPAPIPARPTSLCATARTGPSRPI